MNDDIERALRSELHASLVPFDAERADTMIYAATSAELLHAPRRWVAPLAAAAAVAAIGGTAALMAQGGGGSGTPAGGQPSGRAPSTGAPTDVDNCVWIVRDVPAIHGAGKDDPDAGKTTVGVATPTAMCDKIPLCYASTDGDRTGTPPGDRRRVPAIVRIAVPSSSTGGTGRATIRLTCPDGVVPGRPLQEVVSVPAPTSDSAPGSPGTTGTPQPTESSPPAVSPPPTGHS